MENLHEKNEELLREALVDLDRVRNREARARRETESLLNGLKVLGQAGGVEQMFADLLDVLREILAFDDAFILTRNQAGALVPFASSNERFSRISWQPRDMLRRVIAGQTIAAFDVSVIPEWRDLDEELREGVVSALHAPLTSGERVAILVCTHPERGAFTKRHVETIRRFAPLVQQALVTAESREAAQREKELVLQRELALSESRLKSEFLSTISHELRTPMNAVLGFGQLLEAEVAPTLDPDRQAYLHELMKAGRHLLDLIDGVLSIGRIDSGRLRLDIVDVDLRDLLPECRRLLKEETESGRVTWVDRVLEGPPVMLQADVYHLKKILLNLLGNAIRYNRVGGSVDIRAEKISPERWRIGIRDTGIGLSPDEQGTIFEPFVRGEERRHLVDGTGMVLTIVKRLITLMQGNIGVESEPGQGSLFWIELPAGDAGIG